MSSKSPDFKKINTKYYTFQEFAEAENRTGNNGKVASQLMAMYRTASRMDSPVILELGTDKGQSTTVFLNACKQTGGRLVSIDKRDCSEISQEEYWTFIQADTRDVETILSKAPFLNQGIDLLYIDSLHQKKQVESELLAWYPYMNKNSHIYFDDVDADPYRKGNRKDNFFKEVNVNEIHDYVISFFHANKENHFLDIMYGSTGLAHLFKKSQKGAVPVQPESIYHRKNNIFNKLIGIFKSD